MRNWLNRCWRTEIERGNAEMNRNSEWQKLLTLLGLRAQRKKLRVLEYKSLKERPCHARGQLVLVPHGDTVRLVLTVQRKLWRLVPAAARVKAETTEDTSRTEGKPAPLSPSGLQSTSTAPYWQNLAHQLCRVQAPAWQSLVCREGSGWKSVTGTPQGETMPCDMSSSYDIPHLSDVSIAIVLIYLL